MKAECIQFELGFQGQKRRKIEVRNDGEVSSSDAGLLLLSKIEKEHQWIQRLGECFVDGRDPKLVQHPVVSMLRQMIFGLVQGYEDRKRP